jgi:RNA polymerase sigma-70 factor (ECF subfamily)
MPAAADGATHTPSASSPESFGPTDTGSADTGSADTGSADTGSADTGPSDSHLLAAHVAGDPEAFGVLFTRHQQRLWAVALRTLRNSDDAADAVQDAAISAFRHAASFRGDAAVTTWLHRIVVNACLDRLRRRAARPADPLTDSDGQQSIDPPVPDATEARQTQLDVRAALAMLNPDQRAALVLVDMQGYSVEEAAAVLDCAVGTVKSRCARGRARLAGLLGHLGPAGGDGSTGGNRAALRCVGLRSGESGNARAISEWIGGEVIW